MTTEPCARCGRTLLDLRRDATRDALRGSAPLCSIPACPLVQRVLGFREAPTRTPGTELAGPSPPAVFVGRHGYPNVRLGPLLPPSADLAPTLGANTKLWAQAADIGTILADRARLVRSKALVSVRHPRDAAHALEVSRALAMADRAVETEVSLKKPPRLVFDPKVDAHAAPMGPSVDVVDARVVSSPSVPRRVDALVSDVHADAATGMGELYGAGIDVDHVQRLLSVGLLGEERRRKLVPTRWSITATDDTLSKQLVGTVKNHSLVDAPEVFHSELFGNRFFVLLLPRVWEFEMIEAWIEAGAWGFGHDWEGYEGRTDYADSITGAYYAARLAVLEPLVARRRQAGAFVYREITEDYWAPLGVWVIREGVRAAMAGKPLAFGDVESAVRHVARRSRTQDWTRVARMPREARAQRTLRDFLAE